MSLDIPHRPTFCIVCNVYIYRYPPNAILDSRIQQPSFTLFDKVFRLPEDEDYPCNSNLDNPNATISN
jgi:hypothetical protein